MTIRSSVLSTTSIAMFLRSSAAALAGLAFVASIASAQGCVIDVDHPALIFGAKIAVGKIADEGDQAHMSEKPDHLKRALEVLYNQTQKVDNQIARYYLLGKAYALFLKIDMKGWSPIVQRKRLNLAQDPNGTLDMYAAIDTAFSKVEELNAACADSTNKYRQGVSAIVYNQANEQLNLKKYDSAIVLAKRALVVNPKGAAPWNVIAAAQQAKGDTAQYKVALRKVSQSTETDAAMVKVRQTALYNLAVLTLTQAAKKDGEERKAMAAEAEADLRALIKVKPDDAATQAALSQALQLKGDTVESRKMMEAMVANPDKYTSGTLFGAAVTQYNGEQYETAISLFKAGLKKNPYYRDALFSLANTYVKMGKFDDAVPILLRLQAGDPNNVNTHTMAWNVWRGIIKSGTDEKLKAVATDSSIKYSGLRQDAPVSVEMSTEFDTSNEQATLTGAVQNRSAAPKSYKITFEFLDDKGAVVASSVADVPNVPAKTGMAFTVKAAGKGIVAWRYKPVE